MRRFRPLLVLVMVAAFVPMGAGAEDSGPPIPTPNRFGVNVLPPVPCSAETGNIYELAQYQNEGWFDNGASGARYPGACQRMRYVFGPITVKPGQNDVLLTPTLEKPMFDGYTIRRQPGLVDSTGVVPAVEAVHLHHGTWLYAGDSSSNDPSPYGKGPFWASGEEKTIGLFPKGYGVFMQAKDPWIFLFMVHNATAVPQVLFVTDTIDYVDAAKVPAGTIKATKNLWLDVGQQDWDSEADSYPFNPIFNIQRGFGHVDNGSFYASSIKPVNDNVIHPGTLCYFPSENCARFNSEGNVSAQQGIAPSNGLDRPGDDVVIDDAILGPNLEVDPVTKEDIFGPSDVGTFIVMGGHVHPGGVRDEVSLVRGGVEKPIHISDAFYWDWNDPTIAGAPPVSWDLSMTGVGAQTGWRVLVHRGDIVRLRGVYDSTFGSWYEQMGIVMSWVAPQDTSGLDVFAPGVVFDAGFPAGSPVPAPYDTMGAKCVNDLDVTDGAARLCLRGTVTHGSIKSSQNHAGCSNCAAITTKSADFVTDIAVGGFTYGIADLGVIDVLGVPRVKVNTPVTFWNIDTADYMWHSITRCALPCTGSTSASYPIPDGGIGSPTDLMDFDSTSMGIGIAPSGKYSWTFTPTETGTFAFFCRIHPSMRGALRVE
jgi:plastocyanin